jgi:dTDP-4-amino-4,6-dideoxygalactose transaminase
MSLSIFTSLSPNLEWDDVALAFKLILEPWRWQAGEAPGDLEKKITDDFGTKYAITFESGRTSLATLLGTAPLNPGDEVALQAYTCVAVPNAVRWAGLKPLYIDCDSETLTMSPSDLERRITARTKAIIIQYTFGQVGELKKLLTIANERKLLVIEDCAHVIGGRYGNRLLGTLGHASFMSFGRDKAISGVFGGLALTNDEAWGKRLKNKQKEYRLPSKFWVWQQLLHPIITAKAKLFYDLGGLGKVGFALSKKLGLISKSVETEEKYGNRPTFVFHRMPNALALLILHQYGKLECFNANRKKIAAFYRQSLKDYVSCKLPPEDNSIIFLRFPLRVQNPEGLIGAAKKEKIYLGDWYNEAIAPRGVDYEKIGYKKGSCPVSEAEAKRSVNLPTDIHISAKHGEHIVRVVQAYLKKPI